MRKLFIHEIARFRGFPEIQLLPLCAQMIAKKRNEKDWESVQKLIDIQERLAFELDEMVTVVMTDLHEEPYTLDEVLCCCTLILM